MAALGPVVGDGVAVASAILLRLVWIAAELAAGGVLVMIRPRPIREPGPGLAAESGGRGSPDPAAPAEMGRG
jgi:hypothetical protein